MGRFEVPNLEIIRHQNPRLAEALQGAQDAINSTAQQALVSAQGKAQAPQSPVALSVASQANGLVTISVSDKADSVFYVVEYSSTPQFNGTIYAADLGASKSFILPVGSGKTYYFRVRSYQQPGLPSGPTYFGTLANPTAVTG